MGTVIKSYSLKRSSIRPLVNTSEILVVFCPEPKLLWFAGRTANELNFLVQILVFVFVGNTRQMPTFVLSADLLGFVPRSAVIAGEHDLVRVLSVFKNCREKKHYLKKQKLKFGILSSQGFEEQGKVIIYFFQRNNRHFLVCFREQGLSNFSITQLVV